MPVSTGRVSSRDAERATLQHGLDERRRRGPATRPSPPAPGTAGSPRGAACGCGTSRRPPTSSTSCSAARSSSETLVARQRADDVDEQPRRQHDGALADDLALERHAQADLHVGGAQLDRPAARLELDAGQRLDGAAGRGGAGDGLQLGEEGVALGRDLHRAASRSRRSMMKKRDQSGSSGVWMVCTSSRECPLRAGLGLCTWPVHEPPESVRRAGRHRRRRAAR